MNTTTRPEAIAVAVAALRQANALLIAAIAKATGETP